MKQGKDAQKARMLFAQMSQKEKLNHLWTYYKGHLAIALILIVVVGSFVSAVRTGIMSEGYVHISITEPYAARLEEAVTLLAQEAGWEEELAIAPVSQIEDASGDGIIQWMTSLTADGVDIAICDRATAQAIVEGGYTCSLLPLEESALAHVDTGSADMVIVTLEETSRQEKVLQFSALLTGETQE